MNTSQLPRLFREYASDLPTGQTIEQRIHIAASFDPEKIKMIRELMEEEAISALIAAAEQWSGNITTGDCMVCKDIDHDGSVERCTVNEFYIHYQQSKQTK